jgi:transposase
VIGYDSSEQLHVEPARYLVRVIQREIRFCRSCEQSAVMMGRCSRAESWRGLASDQVVVETVVGKYCDHLPLYRQAAVLEGKRWVIGWGELLISVTKAKRKNLVSGSHLQADETTVPVRTHYGLVRVTNCLQHSRCRRF